MSASEGGGGGGDGVGHSYSDLSGAGGCELEERILFFRFEGEGGSGLRKGGFECSVSGTGAEDERR